MLNISVNLNALKQIILKNKKYEIRLKKGIFTNLNKGDKINLFNRDLSSINSIIDIQEFKSIEQLFNIIDYKLCTPLLNNKSEAIRHIHKFYKPTLLDKYNIIAIRLC